MSSLNPFKDCTDRMNYQAQVGQKKEAWKWQIGSKSKAFQSAPVDQQQKLIENVANDSLQYIADGAERTAQIVIESIGVEPIKGQDGSVKSRQIVHYKLYYGGESTDHTAEGKESPQGVLTAPSFERVDTTRTLLDRFSSINKEEKGPSAKIKKTLAEFFTQVVKPFKGLSEWWGGITGSPQQIRYDLGLLCDTCGTYPSGELPMDQALRYMDKLLRHEDQGMQKPELQQRIGHARQLSKELTRLKGKYSEKRFNKLVGEMQGDISRLKAGSDEKLLIPVGYQHKGEQVEMLMEVKKNENGTCTATLISRSKEARKLFDRKKGIETGSQSLRREISGISEGDLKKSIATLIDLQINPVVMKGNEKIKKIRGEIKTLENAIKHLNETEKNVDVRKQKIETKQKQIEQKTDELTGIVTDTQDTFLRSLDFPQSTVTVGETGEVFKKKEGLGHISEIMSYVKEELLTEQNQEEVDRFEVAARLRFFLDVCNRDQRWLKDPKFRETVRIAAYELVDQIENNRAALIGDGTSDQGKELSRIYGEIKGVLDRFDEVLPEAADLRQAKLSAAELGGAITQQPIPTPILENVPMSVAPLAKIDSPFAPLDPNNPVDSVKKWAERCTQLMQTENFQRAGFEARQMARLLPPPKDPMWAGLNPAQAEEMLKAIGKIGEAVARGSMDKPESSLGDAMAAAVLNLHAYRLGIQVIKEGTEAEKRKYLAPLAYKASRIVEDLIKSRLPMEDKQFLRQFAHVVYPYGVDNSISALIQVLYTVQVQEPFNILFNLSQMTPIAAGELDVDPQDKTALRNLLKKSSLQFTGSYAPGTRSGSEIAGSYTVDTVMATLPDVPIMKRRDMGLVETKLSAVAPEYAKNVAEELGNRYVTEKCPYGCSCDNCANWGKIPKDKHQFYPLYMLYHFTENYCPKLFTDGTLRRDEMTDLLLLQETNRDAAELFGEHHKLELSFKVADGFTEDDRRVQVMASLSMYLKHPNFFQHPELRWFLETKLLTGNYLSLLLKPESIQEHKPFLMSTLTNLNREISIAHANGNLELCGYLVHLIDHINSAIQTSELFDKDKEDLQGVIKFTPEKDLMQWVNDFAAKDDVNSRKKQKAILPYLLSFYAKKISANDPIFDNPTHLQMATYAIGRIQELSTKEDKIDPILQDQCQSLSVLLTPKIQEQLEKDSSSFVNGVLSKLKPTLAGQNLRWEEAGYPLLEATDKDNRKYQFDISRGILYAGGSRLESLPENIKKHPDLIRLYGRKTEMLWGIMGTPNIEGNIRLTAHTHESFPGQRIVVRQEVDEKGNPTKAEPKVTIERETPGGWVSYHRFNAQDLIEKGEDLSGADLPPSIAAAIGDKSCWVSQDQSTIYVFDPTETTAYATVKLGELKEGSREIQGFQYGDGRKLLAAPEEALEEFIPIEDPNFIMVTGQEEQGSQLEYPRLELASSGAKLTYNLTEQGMVSPSFPGYQLAPFGKRPGERHPADAVFPLPETFTQFQMLEKGGTQLILIPARELEQQYSSAGTPLPHFNAKVTAGFKPSAVYEFTVDRETNRLKAKTGDAYAYLAYASLTHHDYSSAAFYLEKARTSIGYSPEYDKIFSWAENWNDPSDSGRAMKLRFSLFKEKVLEDKRMGGIRAGEKGQSVETEDERINRLANLAGHYDRYRDSIAKREIGRQGFDPLLDLTPDEEEQALKLVHELLETAGNQVLKAPEAKPATFKRAIEAPKARALAAPSEEKMCGDSQSVLSLWAFAGSSTSIPGITLGKPEWILNSFNHLFDQLVKLDPKSQEFQDLKQKIRTVDPDQSGLNVDLRTGIKSAQSSLLRLAAARETNQMGEIDQILKSLKGEKLPSLKKPIFGQSREAKLGTATLIKSSLEPLYEAATRDEAMIKIDQRLAAIDLEIGNVPKAKAQFSGEKKKLKAIRSFCEKFTAKEEQASSAQLKGKQLEFPDFQKEYQKCIKEQLYGKEGAEAIDTFSKLFAALEKINIPEQGKQKMAPQEKTEPAAAPPAPPPLPPLPPGGPTFAEKYSTLLSQPPARLKPAVDALVKGGTALEQREAQRGVEISRLEHTLEERVEPPKAVPIETVKTGTFSILGNEQVEEYKKYYQVTKKPPVQIDEKMFDELAASGEKAVQRLANEHREDMKAALSEQKTYKVTRSNAKELRTQIASQQGQAKTKTAQLEKNLLQSVERFDTPAGILAMRRMTGRAAKPSLDYMINLWRRDLLTQPWDQNPLKELGASKMSPQELEKLNLMITEYMEATSQLHHLERTLQAADSYIKSCPKKGGVGDQSLAQAFVEAIEAKSFFSYFTSERPADIVDLANAMTDDRVRENLIAKLEASNIPEHTKLAQQVAKWATELEADGFLSKERFQVLFSDPNNYAILSEMLQKDPEISYRLASDRDYKDLLFLQVKQGISLRRGQVMTNRAMLDNPDAVRQLEMGGGKSKVLLPLLAQRKANGTNLVMLMLPEPLYETNSRDLDGTNRELYGQEIFRFDFDRQSDRSIEALETTYLHLLQTVRDKGFATTTKSSMLNFRNAYFELINTLSNIPPGQEDVQGDKIREIHEQLRAMSKIMKLFNDRTDVLSDEVDACLDVRKEVNFAMGGVKTIDPVISNTGSELMEMILTLDTLAPLATALQNNTQGTLSPNQRTEFLRTLGGAWYDAHHSEMELGPRDAFVNYLLDTDVKEEGMPDFMKTLQSTRPDQFKQASTVKAFLNKGFNNTLARVSNVNYGRDPNSIWTIPFKASNAPSEGSEFDDAIERVSYTLQDYVQNGISFSQLFQVVSEIQKQGIEQMRGGGGDQTLDETAAGQTFREFVQSVDPKGILGANPSLAAFDSEEQVQRLFNLINANPQSRLTFARQYAVNKISQAQVQVNSVSTDVPEMVRHFGGFTGTPWNIHTYHDKIEAKKNLGVDGRTWALMLGRDVEVKTVALDPKDPIGSLLKGADVVGNYQATIDTGAYLRGTSNEDYLNRYLQEAQAKGIPSAGIYFDGAGETSKIVKKEGIDGKPLPIEVAGETDPMANHSLYDQAHTVGADIKQGRRAKAIVTIGEDTFIRDLFQAVWRLRQLHEDQQVALVVSDSVKELILEGQPSRELTVEDILKFCMTNEAKREAEDNFRAEKEKISGMVSRFLLREIVNMIDDDKTSSTEVLNVARQVGGQFAKKRPGDEAYAQYAQPRIKQDPELLLQEAKTAAAKQARVLAGSLEKIGKEPKRSEMAKEIAYELPNLAKSNPKRAAAFLRELVPPNLRASQEEWITATTTKLATAEPDKAAKAVAKIFNTFGDEITTPTISRIHSELCSTEPAFPPFTAANEEIGANLRQFANEIEMRKLPPKEWMPETVDGAAMQGGNEVQVEAQAQVETAVLTTLQQQSVGESDTDIEQERVVASTTPTAQGAGGQVNPLKLDEIKELIKVSSLPPAIERGPPWNRMLSMRQVASCIGAFDPEIYTSAVFERQLLPNDSNLDYSSPDDPNFKNIATTVFYSYRKPVTDVLIAKGPQGWRMIIPTVHEAHRSCREFIDEADAKGTQAVQVSINAGRPNIVYKSGDDRTHALPFTSPEDQKQFYRLYVQAKFFNGEINYGSKEEQEALKEWLKDKGAEGCRNLFEQYILPAKPKRFDDNYRSSTLYQVFNELIK